MTSCSTKNMADKYQNWDSNKKWEYFKDSIASRDYYGRFDLKSCANDSLNNFDVFSKAMFSNTKALNIGNPRIYALEEPYIDTTLIDSNKKWVRILVENSLIGRPYCLIAESKNKRTYITLKAIDDNYVNYCGLLGFTITKVFSDTVFNYIHAQLVSLDFWELEEDSTYSLSRDGEKWTFEAIANGEYNLVSRWSPRDNENLKTKALVEIEYYISTLIMRKEHFELDRIKTTN